MMTAYYPEPTTRRYANTLIGLAAGDAWGYQVEFTRYAKMQHPVPKPAGLWRISDDTQMTLAVHQALTRTPDMRDIDATTDELIASFIDWADSPDNNRAPGNSCMTSIRHLKAGHHWAGPAGAVDSHGCGAVMRLAPAAFAPTDYWAGITALQAVITHKNPTAVVSALLLASAIRNASRRGGRFLHTALEEVAALCGGEHDWNSDPYLADVLDPITTNVTDYLECGLDSVVTALVDAVTALEHYQPRDPHHWDDPCSRVGQGWDSATATALGLLAADLATSTHAGAGTVLGWAATTNGDSDSIASIAGAVIGAGRTDLEFWIGSGIHPQFEPQYEHDLAHAVASSDQITRTSLASAS